MSLAIASPSSSAYSETFIHMQMARLPCVLRVHGGPVAGETVPGGPIHPLGSPRGIIDAAIEYAIGSRTRAGLQQRELLRRLRRCHATAILANYGPTGVALLPVARQLGIPLVVHFHGYDAYHHSLLEKHSSSYALLARQSAAVIVVSQHMAHQLGSLGFSEKQLHLVRYGVDESRFYPHSQAPESPVFFAAGRFVDKKAPYLTLLAFQQAHHVFPRARLILAGTGELLETTRNLAAALGLDAAVDFPGILSPKEIAAHMGRATAFVQHSITPHAGPAAGDSEGTPVAILEAMMAGIPVISTRHAGIPEVLRNGETGLLVEERDVDAMANAMIHLATHPQLASNMGCQARSYALQNHTATQYIHQLSQILSSCT
jgi:colanic acid/amylovoran biosynthesis glycosyltransferase